MYISATTSMAGTIVAIDDKKNDAGPKRLLCEKVVFIGKKGYNYIAQFGLYSYNYIAQIGLYSYSLFYL